MILLFLILLVSVNSVHGQKNYLYPYLYESNSSGTTVTSSFQSLDFSQFDQGYPNLPLELPYEFVSGKNVWLDQYGQPQFYVIGSYIVLPDGKVIDQMVNYDFSGLLSNGIRSDTKTLIVPVPGQSSTCITRFYIITLHDNNAIPSNHLYPPIPYFALLDLSSNINGIHSNGKLVNYGPATVSSLIPNTTFPGGPHNTPTIPFSGNGIEQFNAHLNAVQIPGSQNLLLVFSHITDIHFYLVTSNGIIYQKSYSDYRFENMTIGNNIGTWDLFYNTAYTLSGELEIVKLQNNNWRMAYIVEISSIQDPINSDSLATEITNFIVSVLDFDEQLNYIPDSKKTVEFTRGASNPFPSRPSGLEFTNDGQAIYIVHQRNTSFSNHVILRADLSNSNATISILDSYTGLSNNALDLYSRSHISRDDNNNLILTNGVDILKCTNPESGGTNWILESNVFTSYGGIQLSKGITSFPSYGSYAIASPIKLTNQFPAWRGFDATSYTVNVNQTWTNQSNPFNNPYGIYIKDTLVVASGKTLTINNMSVRFSPSGRILVEPGGKLVANGATLSHDNRCSDAPWHGIQVFGNINQPQSPLHQGILQLNNSTVSYAREAVQLWQEGNYASTGGIVQAINTLFLNNSRSVEFISYPYFSHSKFENCNFEANHLFPASHVNFRAFATMWNVRGLGYFGCDFEVNHPDLVFADQHVFANRGYGILSHDAQYTVTYYCPAGFDPCPAKQNGSFKNLKYAISAHTMEQDRPITVAYTDFIDNQWGIHNVGVNNAVLVRNNFELGKQWSTYSDGANYMGPSEGISVYTGTGFRIEENNFNPSSEFTNIAVGIVVSAAGEADTKPSAIILTVFSTVLFQTISTVINTGIMDFAFYAATLMRCGLIMPLFL